MKKVGKFMADKHKKIIIVVLFLCLPILVELFISGVSTITQKPALYRMVALYGVEVLFLVYKLALRFQKPLSKCLNFLISKRYVIIGTVFILGVVANIHFSSINIWSNFIHENGGANNIFGKSREIRADEWLVQTPALLAQTKNPDGYALRNQQVMQGNCSMLLVNAPVWDLTTISKPLTWGFLLLGAEHGMSWWWLFRVLLLLTVSFEIARVVSKKDNLLSLTGMLLIGLAPAMMWWLSTSVVDAYIFGMAVVVLFHYYMDNLQWAKYKKILLAIGMLICIPAFAFAIYPAYQVPFAFVMMLFMIYELIKHGKDLKKYDYVLMALTLIGVGVILGYFLLVAWPDIQTMMGTVYPGSRSEIGGDYTLKLFAGRFTNLFLPYSDKIANPCEISNYLYPIVGLLVLIVFYFKQQANQKPNIKEQLKTSAEKADKFLEIGLLLLFAFFIVWVYVGFQEILAKVTFLYLSPAKRTQLVCGLLGTILTILFVKKLHGKELLNKVQAIIVSLVVVLASYLLIKDAGYASFFSTIKLELLAIALFTMTYTVVRGNKKAFCYIMCILSLAAGLLVNPIVSCTYILYQTNIAKQIQQFVKEEPEALWIGRYNWSGQYALVNGAKVLNGVNLYPNFQWLMQLDPDKSQEQVYNRYAHIGIILSDHTEFRLLTEDSYEVEVTYQNLKDIGVKYYFTDTKCSKQIEEQFHLKTRYADDEKLQYIYQIN